MKELKVAVSISGRVSILERFPDDEEHAGLHEMLLELELDSVEAGEAPGVYMATFYIDHTQNYDPSDDSAYLDISRLETLPDYFERICLDTPTNELENLQRALRAGNVLLDAETTEVASNLINLADARNAKMTNDNLQNIVNQLNDLSPEAIADQEAAKIEFDNERKHAAALNKEITLGDDWDSKDIYLTTKYGPGKVDVYVGLHAIGHAGQHNYNLQELDGSITIKSSDFYTIEMWGNEYDSITGAMVGRGSFRLNHSDIEEVAKEYEAEGWTRCKKPGKLSTDT